MTQSRRREAVRCHPGPGSIIIAADSPEGNESVRRRGAAKTLLNINAIVGVRTPSSSSSLVSLGSRPTTSNPRSLVCNRRSGPSTTVSTRCNFSRRSTPASPSASRGRPSATEHSLSAKRRSMKQRCGRAVSTTAPGWTGGVAKDCSKPLSLSARSPKLPRFWSHLRSGPRSPDRRANPVTAALPRPVTPPRCGRSSARRPRSGRPTASRRPASAGA